ncbi:hypothetical protein [Streptomyces silvisoli]|uniref:Uncharacterized protein n=1 Tax=Streptomyces silvisoli TaxID=3034235 RepID=A0ABT5ZL99_9ACTN|nr:hypothetical protein [Streptomyces silvisoli]MDF3290365.1 hypothetical protein [Streptomyces silvisoli]
MFNRSRGTLRAAVIAAVGISTIGLASTSAWAKSDIYFSAGPHDVRVGKLIHLTGNGDDDNSTYNRFCIQERSGHGSWRTLRCSRGDYNGGGGINMSIRAQHRGVVQFRGALVEGSSPKDKHPKVRLFSRTFSIDVR